VTTPEIEPVMAAQAASVPRSKHEGMPTRDTNLRIRFTGMTSLKIRISGAGYSKPNDDKEN
jgi:hypothetical protein